MTQMRQNTRMVILATMALIQLATWVQELNMYWFHLAAKGTTWQYIINFLIPDWWLYIYMLVAFIVYLKWPRQVEPFLAFLAMSELDGVYATLTNDIYIMYYMIHAGKVASAISIVMSMAIFFNYYLMWKEWRDQNNWRSQKKDK